MGKIKEMSGLVRALAIQKQEALKKSGDTCEVKIEEGYPTMAHES